MPDHDRDRDNATGRFVTDEYARVNPDGTTSEDVRDPAKNALRAIVHAYDRAAGFVTPPVAETIEAARALI